MYVNEIERLHNDSAKVNIVVFSRKNDEHSITMKVTEKIYLNDIKALPKTIGCSEF